MHSQYDGFWFPAAVREELLTPGRPFEVQHFQSGAPLAGGTPLPEGAPLPGGEPLPKGEAVSVRWPRLDPEDWRRALEILRRNRAGARAEDWQERLPRAMRRLQALWTGEDNPLWLDTLAALETCTGHSAGMLGVALGMLELLSVEDLQRAAACRPTNTARGAFAAMDGLPGRVRFFAESPAAELLARALLGLEGYRRRPLRIDRQPAGLVLGYASGNVPGSGLLLALLALAASAATGGPPPMILIRNSRREPIFTALVLAALEMIDPGLLDTTLVTVWDHEDADVQDLLVAQADLVIAAASDETIAGIGHLVRRHATAAHPIRFHGHGHKVSFSTIGRECLQAGRETPAGVPLVEAVACLAALDVALWNQQGCLSSRVHFVEEGAGPGAHSADDYARAVARSLRALDRAMPKGAGHRRQIHNLYDQYQAVAAGSPLQVLSGYDDDFLVLLDRRELSGEQFRELVNACQGRTVAIVPVADVMEVPGRYLQTVGKRHLQSMSLALGSPDVTGLDPRLVAYAGVLGAAGVTGIRTVGRGAFPQLAYSWDGLLPFDLFARRQRGHFTTIEFGDPWPEIYATYDLIRQALGAGTCEP